MAKILITGSSGMIGSALVESLKGHEVWGLDKYDPAFVTPDNFIRHDFTLPLEKHVRFDLIVHLAANARVHDLVIDPDLSLDNVKMTFNALEYARRMGIPKFIFASSREVYGNGNSLPVAEDIGSQRTSESPYSSSKIAGEAYCHSYRNCYGIDMKIVRFSNVYGRYDYSNRFIPKTIKNIRESNPIEIWGKDKVLDFTYLSDAVDGLAMVIDKWPKENEFNIAYGKGESLLGVAKTLSSIIGREADIKVIGTKKGEVMQYTGDISRMEKLGWSPKVPIEKGLQMAVEYYT